MTSATSAVRQLRGGRADARRPAATIFTGAPICCAAAMASHEARLSDSVLLFCDDENHQKTLASSRSTRTSSPRPPPALPPIMRVCLAFSGM